MLNVTPYPPAVSKLRYIAPFFIVRNLAGSLAFYVDQLGFEARHVSPTIDPFFAIVSRDSITLMLKEINPEVSPQPNYSRHVWARWDAFIFTEDPDGLYQEFTSKQVLFKQSLLTDQDNLRGFEVADVDGYTLYFGRPNA